MKLEGTAHFQKLWDGGFTFRQLSVLPTISLADLTPQQRCNQCILQSHPTRRSCILIKRIQSSDVPDSWGCRIHRLHLCKGVRLPANECPGYGTRQSHGEAPIMQELWEMQSTPLLRSLPGPLWPEVTAPDRVSPMEIELFWHLNCLLMLNWIVWNRTVDMYKMDLALNNLQCHKTQQNQTYIRLIKRVSVIFMNISFLNRFIKIHETFSYETDVRRWEKYLRTHTHTHIHTHTHTHTHIYIYIYV